MTYRRYITVDECRELWAGWAIASGQDGTLKARSPSGDMLSANAFNNQFRGTFQMTAQGHESQQAWRCFVFNELYRFPRVEV